MIADRRTPAHQFRLSYHCSITAYDRRFWWDLGFDAARKEWVDLVAAGIIDPTKVVRVALENAVSVASVLLLTEATMVQIPEEKAPREQPEFG